MTNSIATFKTSAIKTINALISSNDRIGLGNLYISMTEQYEYAVSTKSLIHNLQSVPKQVDALNDEIEKFGWAKRLITEKRKLIKQD